MQGSYKNDTNIRGDSDVDVVAQLNSTFYSNLSEDQKRTLGLTPATYHLSNFRDDVLKILKNYYGQSQITEGNKSIEIKANNGRLPADVIVCAQYRRYKTVNSYDYVEGMTLIVAVVFPATQRPRIFWNACFIMFQVQISIQVIKTLFAIL